MDKIIFINLQKEIFTGNILDIGLGDSGIIYNVYKSANDKYEVDYVEGNEEAILKDYYDSCVLFFSLNNITLKNNKRKFIKKINRWLKDNGHIYIWDIDKGYGKYFNCTLKVMLPDDTIKKVEIRNNNLIQDNSLASTIKLLENSFEIVESRSSNGIYYIKAIKKGSSKDESFISSS